MWQEGAVEPVLAKRCTWEIPSLACRVLSRKPIKAEHMKSYSNLTTPTFPNLTMANSCPNDEWRERFKTRVEGEGVELLCNLNWNPVFAFDKNLSVHRLPCKVDRLEGFVMLWKKDANIITVGEQIIDKVRTKHTQCRTHTNQNTNKQIQQGLQ